MKGLSNRKNDMNGSNVEVNRHECGDGKEVERHGLNEAGMWGDTDRMKYRG